MLGNRLQPVDWLNRMKTSYKKERSISLYTVSPECQVCLLRTKLPELRARKITVVDIIDFNVCWWAKKNSWIIKNFVAAVSCSVCPSVCWSHGHQPVSKSNITIRKVFLCVKWKSSIYFWAKLYSKILVQNFSPKIDSKFLVKSPCPKFLSKTIFQIILFI